MDYKINDEEHNQPSSDSTQLGNSTQVLHRSALTSALPATSNVFNRFCGVNDTSLCDVLQAPISCSLPANTLKSEFKATALHVDETRNVKESGIIPISSHCRYYSCSHDADKESESSIDHDELQLLSSMLEDIFVMSDEEISTSGNEEDRASASTNERSSSAAHEPTSTSGNPRYYSDESTMTSKSICIVVLRRSSVGLNRFARDYERMSTL